MWNLSVSILLFLPLCLAAGLKFPGEVSSSRRILTGDPPSKFPGILNAPAPVPDISSRSPWRLEIEEGSLLFGSLGQRSNVRIRLTNLEQGERLFRMAVSESGQGQFRLIESVSQPSLRVGGGQYKVFTINIRIPETLKSGHRDIIRVTATTSDSPELIRIVTSGDDTRVNQNYVQMDFSFLIAPTFRDAQSPRIASLYKFPIEAQCSNIDDCTHKYWKAIYHIKDDESGIRSIETNPFIGLNSGSLKFVHNPYVLGDPQEEVRFVLTGSCCEKGLDLIATDGFGNEKTVSLIPNGDTSSSTMGLNGTEIAIIVVSIILIVLFIGIITAIVIIRQRRAESINEMRRFPTPSARA